MYGEIHSVNAILDRELTLWRGFYEEQGFRHLFIELPYSTGALLNLWMRADSDALLDVIFADIAGTAAGTAQTKDFYRAVKADCPETVFHGTDMGHQYQSTGLYYLDYLENLGLADSPEYRLGQESNEQGAYYAARGDEVYRENTMVENFVREWESLDGESAMGIYGALHTPLRGLESTTGSVPCMASQLYEKYGAAVHSEDLSTLDGVTYVAPDRAPLRVDAITVDGVSYEASWFGREDFSFFSPEYAYREFWRLEGAYDALSQKPATGGLLPYENFPTQVYAGQVFIVDYGMADGTVARAYYRASTEMCNGKISAEEFSLS